MGDLQAIADRVEIEALRGEFTDAVMTNDHDRFASLFTPDGAVRIPLGNIEAACLEEIRALSQRRQALADYFVQTTHPGTIQLDGDTATGRAYLSELARGRDGSSHLNYFVYHDRYQRTPDGWKFIERVAEFRYLDTTPLAGSAPHAAEGARGPGGRVCGSFVGEDAQSAEPTGRGEPRPSAKPTCVLAQTPWVHCRRSARQAATSGALSPCGTRKKEQKPAFAE